MYIPQQHYKIAHVVNRFTYNTLFEEMSITLILLVNILTPQGHPVA